MMRGSKRVSRALWLVAVTVAAYGQTPPPAAEPEIVMERPDITLPPLCSSDCLSTRLARIGRRLERFLSRSQPEAGPEAQQHPGHEDAAQVTRMSDHIMTPGRGAEFAQSIEQLQLGIVKFFQEFLPDSPNSSRRLPASSSNLLSYLVMRSFFLSGSLIFSLSQFSPLARVSRSPGTLSV